MVSGRGPLCWAGWALLAAFVAVALLAPLLAPHDPRLSTGRPLSSPTASHLLGTNDLGQDVFSQLLYGARSSLIVAALVTAISVALSWTVGLAAGVFRRCEVPLMLATDLMVALPIIPLYLLVLTLLGAGLRNVVLVLGLTSWPAFARVVRSVAIGVRSAPYVEASRALGAHESHVICRHLLPATLDVLPTKLVLTVRFAVFAEATIAFLGLGSGDSISWGTMLSWAFADPLLFARPVWPWLVLPPTLAIVGLILATVWISIGFTESRRGRSSHPRRNRLPALAERPAAVRTSPAATTSQEPDRDDPAPTHNGGIRAEWRPQIDG